ncbi:hypothetical protein [Flavihumibacter sp. UBA7668]|uniref:hypothetical protein n=1 Tax=Flavihumibacter sp. UBA7668 TaxID=1946542 RepID=UPI0025C41887|nr:hypothetical protein [Flavihumibacter sp. UBA7668]
MKKNKISFALLTIAALLSLLNLSCKRDEPDEPVFPTRQQYLLKSIQWEEGTKSDFSYNPDSTIKERSDRSGQRRELTSFVWENGRMVQHAQESSLYTNSYNYSTSGQISGIRNRYKDIPLTNGYELKFQYQSNGLLAKMQYNQINEAGETLIQEAIYQYNNKELIKIQGFDKLGRLKLENSIESYSDSCDFLPWVFISTSLSPLYQIYNYPVLSNMKKLPTRIVQKLYDNDGIVSSTYIYINQPVIDGYAIKELKQEVLHPDNPTYNSANTGTFLY